MARSSTTAGKGNKLALKHGGYARTRLAEQNAILEEARARLKAGQLGPLEEELTRALSLTRQLLDDVYGWLDQHGGPLTPHGRVKPAATYADRLLVHYASQAATLHRLRQQLNPDIQAMTQEEAQRFLGEQYRQDVPSTASSAPPAPPTPLTSALSAPPPTTPGS